ncbi:MAG: zinc ABC transporter substrate-binding protein [Candidatus Rokubacteria bacterium]|nr:zinc ABC transporter substrate-binding protein [Candidatus Rokubacteria bacterium]
MPRLLRGILAALSSLGVLVAGAPADATVRAVASTPDLKSLTELVGGGLVEVDALARGNQNVHDVEVRPSLMVKLRRADLLVVNGLELDGWAEAVVQGANNPRLLVGGVGRVDASRGVPVLEVPAGRVDRSMGDVHPQGNPHYTLDPQTAAIVTANIVEGLTRVAPADREAFETRRREFLGRLGAAQARWTKTLEAFRGARVVVNHNSWIYFLSRFGLEQAGTVEDRPGIPPSPGHLARLIQQMRQERIKVLILEPWGDRKLAERVANEAAARVVVLAHTVGAVKGVESYLDLFDYNVNALAEALK